MAVIGSPLSLIRSQLGLGGLWRLPITPNLTDQGRSPLRAKDKHRERFCISFCHCQSSLLSFVLLLNIRLKERFRLERLDWALKVANYTIIKTCTIKYLSPSSLLPFPHWASSFCREIKADLIFEPVSNWLEIALGFSDTPSTLHSQ